MENAPARLTVHTIYACRVARTTLAPGAPEKEPGRIRQMINVFRMTIKQDRLAIWLLGGAFIGPVLLGVLAGLLLSIDNWLGLVLYVLVGVALGVLLFLVVLGRRAEGAAYKQIEGSPVR